MNRRHFLLTSAAAALAPAQTPSDPFPGDWEGKRTAPPRLAQLCAQVFPLGKGAYQINFLPEFDQRCPLYSTAEGQLDGGRIRFSASGWSGEVTPDRMRGECPVQGKPAAFDLKKTVRLSPLLNDPPPSGAIVLFDGKELAHWSGINRKSETGDIHWVAANGILKGTPIENSQDSMRHIATKAAFSAYRLHIEFRSPLMPDARGQARGNSGVVFEDYAYHELQILDSYGLPSYYDDCGAIYKVAAPMVNMCAPPLQWQTYDVTYRAPRYSAALRLEEPGRITVNHNGKLIHNQFELPDSPAAEKLRQDSPKSRRPGRIRLTYHNDAVEFRNIWLIKT